MHICLLTWESYHSVAVGGVAAHVSGLAAVMARKGHDVLPARADERERAVEIEDGCPQLAAGGRADDLDAVGQGRNQEAQEGPDPQPHAARDVEKGVHYFDPVDLTLI